MRRGSLSRLVLALLALVMMAGCAQVQVEEHRTAQAAVVDDGVSGAVNIVGIDFDPPLEYLKTYPYQGITLLVAVENRSAQPLSDLRIRARLPLNDQGQVLEREGVLPHLPPHTIRVYRFPRLRQLPSRRVYALEIMVLSPDGQRVLNRREYTVRIVDR